MTTPKDKKPRTGSNHIVKRDKQSDSRPDGVFDLNDEIQTFRRRKASIDGVSQSGENISFDTADKLAEEIAALRTRK